MPPPRLTGATPSPYGPAALGAGSSVVEHVTFNHVVAGSIPARLTTLPTPPNPPLSSPLARGGAEDDRDRVPAPEERRLGEGAGRMTRETAIAALRVCQMMVQEDPEKAHAEADEVLRSLLRSLGYDDVVEEFDKAINWFA